MANYDSLSYLIGSCLSFTLGFAVASFLPQEWRTPTKAYEYDVNKDGRSDFIVRDGRGETYLFLKREDGSFLRSDLYEKEIKKYAESELESLSKKAEAEIK